LYEGLISRIFKELKEDKHHKNKHQLLMGNELNSFSKKKYKWPMNA
jgi:hypothetical protein